MQSLLASSFLLSFPAHPILIETQQTMRGLIDLPVTVTNVLSKMSPGEIPCFFRPFLYDNYIRKNRKKEDISSEDILERTFLAVFDLPTVYHAA
jgi:hypothetical protein